MPRGFEVANGRESCWRFWSGSKRNLTLFTRVSPEDVPTRNGHHYYLLEIWLSAEHPLTCNVTVYEQAFTDIAEIVIP